MTSEAEAAAANPVRKSLLWLVAVGFFMQTLDATIINTALPAMAASLGESPLRMQSVVVAYALTMAMLIPASGWIADRFGTRRVFFSAIVLFALGSVLCALSHSLGQLVAARVVQGLGGALLLPVGRLSLLRTVPRGEFLQAMSFVAIPGLIGPLLGPTLGGWLVQYASWHWIFLINVPVGLAGCIATLRYMPDLRGVVLKRFDSVGYALLAFGMVAISLALDGVGLRQGGVMVVLIFGFASIVAYWLRAARTPEPLFSPSLFHVPTLSIGLIGNLFSRLGSSCMPFLVPLLLQVSMGYSPVHAGLMMLPIALAGMAMKRFATPLITRHGYRRVLVVNTILVGCTMASFGLTAPGQPMALHLLQLLAFGAVNSLQFTAMNTITLKDLDGSMASSGNSLLSMVQMLAMSMGVAAAGAVLAGYNGIFGTDTPAHTLDAFQATFASMGLITVASALIFWHLPSEVRAPHPAQPEVSGQG
ncbi:multidrug transporter subunit MdtD [Variovorax sp. NFACC27]|uniref:DHA2 family efflux MFS transporter permease subunit n=1 Tax=Variovorax gossypii TaxID=1679495 RepID=A0A3S0JTB2_9BURK|nr:MULTISPECIES: multidrug transporter subunit MdtD [Variovorax]MDP9606802.1 EmrB/QacA subfamily drug resistance transporter [Variovorax paradoxus]SEF29611.1 drug resistance transporter, EmrB/QacA subfamily [Variovorax sp. NFACC28]SEG93873.1 drug resistance transporter, EmrB/QacA subfamily [Variovorax sp. NFACC29]SFD59365.1 drug resistance transporter, EmrB/QacA subfamily [Variovorax sp. NFACC26]SFG89442.1 drug resistance transporter, EmrB/QacA subfamily [Variovorax sp. NFACC27]